MRCERVRYLYEEYTQGSLPVATMARVEEHLAACPACREYFDQSDAIAQLLRQGSQIAHPGPQYFEDLNARVLRRLDEASAIPVSDPDNILRIPTAQWRRPLWWVGGMAAAALVALGLVPQLAQSPSDLTGPSASRMVATAPGAAEPTPLEIAAGPDVSQKNKALNPNLNPAATGPAEGAKLASRNLDKGLAGLTKNNSFVEEMIASTSVPGYSQRSQPERESIGEAERKATQDTEVRMTALKNEATKKGAIPTEIFEQLQVLKTQITNGGGKELRRSMGQLEDMVGERMGIRQSDLDALPIVKQVKLYLSAEDALEAGRVGDAFNNYRRILFVDEHSPLALRACLQMADLFYSEWANFGEARAYYQRCRDAGDAKVFNSIELSVINKQLERLERYKEGNWQALDRLHKVRRGNWNEALANLRDLMALAGADPLLPEAARTILGRMNSTPKPSAPVTVEIYNLLAKRAKEEQNVDVRAWLELALGDMLNSQFQDPQRASEHYYRSLAAAPNSDAAKQARAKLTELVDHNLAESVRNRN